MVNSVRELQDLACRGTARTIAVPWPHDEDVLVSLDKAAAAGLVRPLLVGRRSVIESVRGAIGLRGLDEEIVERGTEAEAVEVAVRKVASGEAQMLMKGLVSTSLFLRGILNKEWGLRQRPLLSHVALYETPAPERLVLFTDVAMNIAPNLDQKVQILENAVNLAHRLGIERPRVAAIAAVETVSADMPATLDAALLAKMSDRGQIKGCVVDGPLALDNALSAEAARHKGITSPVAGAADILLLPDIEAGNVLYKIMGLLGQRPLAAILVGASAPVVLTSRADSDQTKFNSIALAAAISR
ncbi:MAG TPA: bifunctional enoyl-CoA hydratase/phosphate acetyltransferase [Vicinamibacterales bacterium]|nr:bifunctional enoyl-CoA hydratase/phosphate acetyltransferase [Vicinamibacterales bacterium]